MARDVTTTAQLILWRDDSVSVLGGAFELWARDEEQIEQVLINQRLMESSRP